MKITQYHLSCPYFINGHKNTQGMAICDSINQDAMVLDRSDNESWFMDNLSSDDAELYQISIVKNEYLTDEAKDVLDGVDTLKCLLDDYADYVQNNTDNNDYEELLNIVQEAIDKLQN